jgi:hypothetical protein
VVSSGRRKVYRLSLRGNRWINHAIHMAAVTQIRYPTAGRAYYDRKLAGTAELLITREWAILAGENDYTTGTFEQITGRPPAPGRRVPARLPRGIPLMPARHI